MKVLFDANWLAGYIPGSYMHGGLRVTYELAKRLAVTHNPNVDFTLTDIDVTRYYQLRHLLRLEFAAPASKAVTNDSLLLQAYFKLAHVIGTQRGLGYVKSKHDILRQCQIAKYDIYHSPVEAIPTVIRENKKIRKYLTALDLIPLVKPELSYFGFSQQLHAIYQSIDNETVVLAISQSTKNDLLNYRKDVKEENVIVTYIAADKEVFRPVEKNNQTAGILKKYNVEENNYFFTLSALAKFKNTAHTITSFLQFITETKNCFVKLLLVGRSRDAAYENDIYSMYRNHPQIVFVDFIPEHELPVVYNNCISFVYMSLYEGFGLPIVEAMQCATPVICSNTSSMPEVIGNAGICIDPTDADKLCDAMQVMMNNAQQRQEYIRMGVERAKLFSWDRYTEDVIEAYKKTM
jgi:glycosyltransferase involved in cell wall biosynthesis